MKISISKSLTSPKGVGVLPRNLVLNLKNLTLNGANLILRTR